MKKKAESKMIPAIVPEAEKRITLAQEAHVEMEERKSVFIGHAKPVTCEQDARFFIEKIRHQYADATHNVYAYLLNGGAVARYSDDGEPHGTAGIPVLNVLKMSGAMDMVVLVTRYFGGILLGAGGLVRAYSASAKLAVDAAGLAVYEPWSIVSIQCSYSDYQKLTAGIPKIGAKEENAVFGECVTVTIAVKTEKVEVLSVYVSETTGGKSKMESIGVEERAAILTSAG